MNYDDYTDDKIKKKDKKKEKVKEEKQEEKIDNDNPYKDYLKEVKKEKDIDDSLDKPREFEEEVIIKSKNDIKNKKSNTLFYTIMGIIFSLLIIFVLFLIIYTNYKK